MLKYTDYDIVFSEVPDEVTLAINISNCPNGCKGCHSPQLWQDIGDPLDEEALNRLMERYGKGISCVCFMGGDRFPQEVETLSLFVKQACPSLKTAWYSGKPEVSPLVRPVSFDYIKLGGYDETKGSLKSRTTNQRLYRIEADGTFTDLTSWFWNPR